MKTIFIAVIVALLAGIWMAVNFLASFLPERKRD